MCVSPFQSSYKVREIGALERQITRTVVTMLLEKYVLFKFEDHQYSYILDVLFKLEHFSILVYRSLSLRYNNFGHVTFRVFIFIIIP